MVIDCDGCAMRNLACHDCVVSVLLGMPAVGSEHVAHVAHEAAVAPAPRPVEVTAGEQMALAVLSEHGMVPPLRLVPVVRGEAAPRGAVHRAG